jgi:hypothetical protein
MDAVMRVFVWYYIIVLGLLLPELVLLMVSNIRRNFTAHHICDDNTTTKFKKK